jgi:predicted metal-binding membrane protein
VERATGGCAGIGLFFRLVALAVHVRRLPPRAVLATIALLAGALVAWIFTVDRMRGMDAGPGTDLGGFGWYVGIWVTMMAAMMLPSAAPMVLFFSRVSAERARRGQPFVPTWVFAAGYLGVWTAYGLAAYGLYRAVAAVEHGFLDWDRAGPYVAGAAIALAGVYELTPLKSVCLRHCRSPMHFVLGGWRNGWRGAVRMGAEHGAYCVGCCWGLMVVLFAVGVMSLFWMAIVAGVIFVQKLLPGWERVVPAFAALLVGLGIWVAAAPGSVPGLTEPDSPAADQARMRMMGGPGMSQEPGMQKQKEPGMTKTPAMTSPAATQPGMSMDEGP